MRAAYRIHCVTCEKNKDSKSVIYEGESGFSGRQRGNEHLRIWKARDSKSVLNNHDIIYHNEQRAEYRMEVLRNYKTAFERQSNEPVRINLSKRSKHIININSKN